MHFTQSFIVCVALAALFSRAGLSTAVAVSLATAGTLAAAGFDELQQSWRPERNVELADIGAGTGGLLVAVGLLLRPAHSRLSPMLAASGVALAVVITYQSYLYTSDYNLGVLAERDGRRAEALQHYLASVNSGVGNPEAFNAAAWLIAEFGEGDPREAVAYAQRSLELRPNNPDTLDTYGWSLFRAREYAAAVGPLEAAYAVKPDIYCIHYHLGMTYLQLGRLDDGIRHLRRQVELMPFTREAELAVNELNRLNQPVAQP
jgi:tetratricopeptide (TPR) repeat protein